MSSPTGILRYAGNWNILTEYSYGMLVVASNSLSYALGVPTNTGTDPTSIGAGSIWFLITDNKLTPITSSSNGVVVGTTSINIATLSFTPTNVSAYVTATVNYTPTSAAGTAMSIQLGSISPGGGIIDLCTVVSTGSGNSASATLGGIIQGMTPGQPVQVYIFAFCLLVPTPGAFTIDRANIYSLYNIPAPFVIP
jgi:hypothetical protein